MRWHMREHSMTGISRTFPRTITLMTVTRPTRRRRTAGGAGMSALITAEKICFSSTEQEQHRRGDVCAGRV